MKAIYEVLLRQLTRARTRVICLFHRVSRNVPFEVSLTSLGNLLTHLRTIRFSALISIPHQSLSIPGSIVVWKGFPLCLCLSSLYSITPRSFLINVGVIKFRLRRKQNFLHLVQRVLGPLFGDGFPSFSPTRER